VGDVRRREYFGARNPLRAHNERLPARHQSERRGILQSQKVKALVRMIVSLRSVMTALPLYGCRNK
jgi:hypothetical protein